MADDNNNQGGNGNNGDDDKSTDTKPIEPGKMTSEEIAQFIKDNPNFKAYQDGVVTSGIKTFETNAAEKAKAAQDLKDKEAADKEATEAATKANKEMPEYMKLFMERMGRLEKASEQKTLEQQIAAECDKAGIPQSMRKFVRSIDDIAPLAATLQDELKVALKTANIGPDNQPLGKEKTGVGALTPEQTKAAKDAGIKPEDYKKTLDERQKLFDDDKKARSL